MKRMIKLSWILAFVLMGNLLTAQTQGDDERGDDPFGDSWTDRLVYGGNILPGYSNGWILDASPMVGYKLTNTMIAGVGFNYSYRSFRNPYDRFQQIWNMYGGRAFVMQDLLFGVFAQAEYDYHFLRYRERDPFDNEIYRFEGQSPGFLVGGGYSQRSGRVGYNFTVLYDLLYDRNSIGRPNSFGPILLRGGIIFGL